MFYGSHVFVYLLHEQIKTASFTIRKSFRRKVGNLQLERFNALLPLLLLRQKTVDMTLLPLHPILQVRNLRLGPLLDQPVLVPGTTHKSRDSDARSAAASTHCIIRYKSLASAPSYGTRVKQCCFIQFFSHAQPVAVHRYPSPASSCRQVRPWLRQ